MSNTSNVILNAECYNISNTKISGTLHVTKAQKNDSSITAKGEVTGKGVKLSTHTHTIASGSSAGKTKKPD